MKAEVCLRAVCQAECRAAPKASTKPPLLPLSFSPPLFNQPKYPAPHSFMPYCRLVIRTLPGQTEPVVIVASAEFTLKSSPVRRTLEQRLIDDLPVALSRAGFHGFTVEKYGEVRGSWPLRIRLGIRCQILHKVFGVAYAAPASLLPPSMHAVVEKIGCMHKPLWDLGNHSPFAAITLCPPHFIDAMSKSKADPKSYTP